MRRHLHLRCLRRNPHTRRDVMGTAGQFLRRNRSAISVARVGIMRRFLRRHLFRMPWLCKIGGA